MALRVWVGTVHQPTRANLRRRSEGTEATDARSLLPIVRVPPDAGAVHPPRSAATAADA
ncbi:hypothetical protein ACFFRL_06865 [Agromyces hippuratus]|uniref:hypothetical protein n=1 Tax=Agromyces hippuratus TaxID=286438 RepID=UPI0035E63076